MCSIAGVIDFRAVPSPELQSVTRRMGATMSHRGPDQRGQLQLPCASFDHRRLSIIGLESGRQPMTDAAADTTLVYNGEVYNYRELRSELRSHRAFHTECDSEVVLAAATRWGTRFADRLEGMFAYAVWDNRAERLLCGVDAFGIKPLYYAVRGDVLMFASELRGVAEGLRALGAPLEPNPAALGTYLRTGWFPAPSTPLRGVRKLGPGERFEFDREGLRMLDPIALPTDVDIGSQPLERLDELLRRSVRAHLVSDVPVGMLLSGGVDSTLITAMAAREGPLQTFTVGFEGDSNAVARLDERTFAREVSKLTGTRHHEIGVSEREVRDSLPDSLMAMDEPIADPAVVPLLVISRFAARHVKVCLCGDGGDELFGGYRRHRIHRLKNRLHRWDRSGPMIRAVAERLPTATGHGGFHEVGRKWRVGLEMVGSPDYVPGPFAGRHSGYLAPTASLRDRAGDYPMTLKEMRRHDLFGQLAGQHLPKTDRVAMWASLEVRVPFLDRRLAGFALGLPSRCLVGRKGKVLLRALGERYVGREIMNRPKQGFRVPLGMWFRESLAPWVRDRLSSTRWVIPEGVLPHAAAASVLEAHLRGEQEHSIRLWTLLALNEWLWATLSPASADVSP